MNQQPGRGAGHNPANRYAPSQVSAEYDGWWQDETPVSLATEVRVERARTIIARNRSPDIPFDRSINAYRGCEHGCIYCFARPSHAWLDLSPGLDFETRLVAKTNAAERLRTELAQRGYDCRPIALGTNTDPYQPAEREHRITRQILALLLECRHPVSIVTKGSLILRDLDILQELSARRLCKVMISITTLDRELKRSLEPRAADPLARLRVLKALSDAGVPCGVMVAPLIPALTDHELESILERSAQAGATDAGYIFIRLPLEVAPLFEDWLEQHVPGRKSHVLGLIRQSRNGRLYQSDFASRQRGSGLFADLLRQRFERTCRRLRLSTGTAMELDCQAFRPPSPTGQMSLL